MPDNLVFWDLGEIWSRGPRSSRSTRTMRVEQKLRVASDNMLELSGSTRYQRLMGERNGPGHLPA